jgi:hypothetical protein
MGLEPDDVSDELHAQNRISAVFDPPLEKLVRTIEGDIGKQ